ncbi:hypothetical protein DSL72_007191 [Monilinia vaccinii-corymbosi]|uniref:Uncharacterized protein n=1 Tax=Monilinia vaccinii-corymbosi TaxID=61207 RepID=A0A8A3PKX9_9HELO|nr:hypothetical protein DSL72_007191 [Monilinia vaccinii-corymbosi]
MARGPKDYSREFSNSNPGLESDLVMPGIGEQQEREAKKEVTRAEGKGDKEEEAQSARYTRRMQTRAAIEDKRGTWWDEEQKQTDEAARRCQLEPLESRSEAGSRVHEVGGREMMEI